MPLQQEDILLSTSQTYSSPYVVFNGVNIKGSGPLCTTGRGTFVNFNVAETDGFIFGTLGDPYNQTGGGLEQAHIVKTVGVGGKAISLLAPSAQMRCGETYLDGLLVYGSGTGRWLTGIYIDGSNLTTPGSAGVRRTIVGGKRGVRVHGADLAFHAKNAVHCCVSNFQADPGGGAGQAKVLIEGGQNHLWNNLIINGDFEINGTLNISIASSYIDRIIVKGNAIGVAIQATCNHLVVEAGARGTFFGNINTSKTINETTLFKVWSNLP